MNRTQKIAKVGAYALLGANWFLWVSLFVTVSIDWANAQIASAQVPEREDRWQDYTRSYFQ